MSKVILMSVFVGLALGAVGVAAADDFEIVDTNLFLSQHLRPDARSLGMGSAFTALAEGPAATWWNPAALREGHSVSTGYFKPDLIVENQEFEVVSAAIELGYLRISGLQSEFRPATAAAGGAVRCERIRTAGASLDMGYVIFGPDKPIIFNIGGNYKWYETDVEATETLQDFDLEDYDLGVILGWKSRIRDAESGYDWWGWRFGGVLTNVDQAGFKNELNQTTHQLRSRARVGFALEGNHGWTDRMGHLIRWVASVEQESDFDSEDPESETLLRYGAEVTAFRMFSARIGYDDRGEQSAYGGLSYGLSVQADPTEGWLGFRFDYAGIEIDSLLNSADRLDRFGAAVWLKF